MAAFYAFAGAHPWLTFFLAWIIGWVLTSPFSLAFKAFSRAMRARNIAAAGWPPAHLDADGDAITKDRDDG